MVSGTNCESPTMSNVFSTFWLCVFNDVQCDQLELQLTRIANLSVCTTIRLMPLIEVIVRRGSLIRESIEPSDNISRMTKRDLLWCIRCMTSSWIPMCSCVVLHMRWSCCWYTIQDVFLCAGWHSCDPCCLSDDNWVGSWCRGPFRAQRLQTGCTCNLHYSDEDKFLDGLNWRWFRRKVDSVLFSCPLGPDSLFLPVLQGAFSVIAPLFTTPLLSSSVFCK